MLIANGKGTVKVPLRECDNDPDPRLKELRATTKTKTVNGEVQIQALVDGKKVIVTETSVRRALQLKDAKGTECLPNATIFAKLERMSAKTTVWNEFSSTMAKNLEGGVKFLMYPRRKMFSGRVTPLFKTMMVQAPKELEPITTKAANEEHVPTHSNDPLLIKNTKTSQAAEITKLKERVKKLERRNKSRTPGLKSLRKVGRSVQVVSSVDEGLGTQEDASKQGRKIIDLDANEEEVKVEKAVSTAKVTTISATIRIVDELTLAQTLIEIKVAKPKAITTATTNVFTRPKARGVVVQEPSEFKTTTSSSQTSQHPQVKDKGKAKMIEPEKPLKRKIKFWWMKKLLKDFKKNSLIEANYELAQRLQAEEQGELTIEE
ncbi:hypothetical protein Tco_0344386 [Tanacetum coccineum]